MRKYGHHVLFLISSMFILLATGILPANSLLHQPDINPIPYQPGERLIYKVKISGIPAGRWEMNVLAETDINGETVYHFQSEANTKGLFKLYKFRDSQESYVSKSDFFPVRYEKDLRDRSYRAQIVVDFKHDLGQADQLYNGKRHYLKISAGIQDELSMVYLMRRKQIEPGKRYEFDLLTLKKMFHVFVQVLPRERIKTVLGKRETLVLRSTHGYQIWLTNDEQRIPVRIEAQTRIGKLTGELEAIQ